MVGELLSSPTIFMPSGGGAKCISFILKNNLIYIIIGLIKLFCRKIVGVVFSKRFLYNFVYPYFCYKRPVKAMPKNKNAGRI